MWVDPELARELGHRQDEPFVRGLGGEQGEGDAAVRVLAGLAEHGCERLEVGDGDRARQEPAGVLRHALGDGAVRCAPHDLVHGAPV